jgi:NADH dehydrogenase
MYDKRPGLVTVFGGGGFIGRYVCETLFKAGIRVRVAGRHPRRAFFLQPLAAVGQLDLIAADITRRGSVSRAVEGASAVINLVGTLKGDFEALQAGGAGIVAEETARAGAGALVHISAIGADPASPSRYGASKGHGEAKVRSAFKQATLIRPSLVFGPEDQLTNRFATLMSLLPVYPVIAPKTRFQPVYVRDLAQAIAAAALDPNTHGGKTYEIAGPDVVTMRELTENIAATAGQSPSLFDLPDFAADALSYLGFLPGAPLTPRSVDDAEDRQCCRQEVAGPCRLRDHPDADGRGRRRMARPLPSRRTLCCPQRGFGFLNARPPARHHPRHRRGGHRISAGLLDRAFDPGDRADGL